MRQSQKTRVGMWRVRLQSHQAQDQVTYLNRRNSARLVLEVVGDRNSKIGRGKVFEHERRQSHQVYEQVTTNV